MHLGNLTAVAVSIYYPAQEHEYGGAIKRSREGAAGRIGVRPLTTSTPAIDQASTISTPVALVVFNRPRLTEIVFSAIAQVRPSKLFVIADGPRPGHASDIPKCVETRAIIDRVDWPCEVLRNYSDVNLGCKMRPASGIDWVFSMVEDAIVLEDDCVPHPTFFRFCQELLEEYRHDQRLMMISGTNLLGKWKSDQQSYHFSYHGGNWGWASWRRAWQYFDVEMRLWAEPEVKARIRDVVANPALYPSIETAFDAVHSGTMVDAWDYQWYFARLLQSGLSVVPSVNLVSNIGFGEEASHTSTAKSPIANLPVYPMSFPLKRPYGITDDRRFHELCSLLPTRSLLQRISSLFRHILPGWPKAST